MECKICKKEFKAKDKRNLYCSAECIEHARLLRYNEKVKKNAENIVGEENVDFVICKWCGMKVKRIYGKHIANFHPEKTSKDYKKEFPNSLLTGSKDKLSTSINSGLHMKKPEYKELFKQMVLGENNPNHKSKTTDLQRKERSPFSKEFKNHKSEEDRQNFIKFALKDRITETQLQYWLNKGYSLDDAKAKLKKRQQTFSKEICIHKYGKIKGVRIWKQRQIKWLSNYKFSNFSQVSQQLFKSIYQIVKDKYKEFYFATLDENKQFDESGKNHEYRLSLSDKIILPDFFIKDIGKIIEFDGTYWHRKNPENKTREAQRDKAIIKAGYKVMHVSEYTYKTEPEKTIKDCISFLAS